MYIFYTSQGIAVIDGPFMSTVWFAERQNQKQWKGESLGRAARPAKLFIKTKKPIQDWHTSESKLNSIDKGGREKKKD